MAWLTLPKERALRLRSFDGVETTLVVRHDAVELLHGRGDRFVALSIAPTVAARVAAFLVGWWIWSCWLGWRELLWRWYYDGGAEADDLERRRRAASPRRYRASADAAGSSILRP